MAKHLAETKPHRSDGRVVALQSGAAHGPCRRARVAVKGAAAPRETGSQRDRRWPLLLLWTGPKHSGKTTAAAHLVAAARAEGFVVGGFLAPARYEREQLVGFDLLDLQNGSRIPLARLDPGEEVSTGRFHFSPEALTYGNDALGRAAGQEADVVIVDEFGPLEIACQGWRSAVDALLAIGEAPLLLIARQELVNRIRHLYEDATCIVLPAAKPESIEEALGIVQILRQTRGSEDRKPRHSARVPLEAERNSAGQMQTVEHKEA